MAPIDLFVVDADAFGYQLAIRTSDATCSHQLVTKQSEGGLMPQGLLPPRRLPQAPGGRPSRADRGDYFSGVGLPLLPPAERNADTAVRLRKELVQGIMTDTYRPRMTERQLQDAIVEYSRALGHTHIHHAFLSINSESGSWIRPPAPAAIVIVEVKTEIGTVSPARDDRPARPGGARRDRGGDLPSDRLRGRAGELLRGEAMQDIPGPIGLDAYQAKVGTWG